MGVSEYWRCWVLDPIPILHYSIIPILHPSLTSVPLLFLTGSTSSRICSERYSSSSTSPRPVMLRGRGSRTGTISLMRPGRAVKEHDPITEQYRLVQAMSHIDEGPFGLLPDAHEFYLQDLAGLGIQ